MNNNISYGKFITRMVFATAVIIAFLFLMYAYFIQSKSIEDNIKHRTSVTTDIIFESLFSTMKAGGSKTEIYKLVSDIESKIPNSHIKINKTVSDTSHEAVTQAFSTGKASILKHDYHLDYAKPIIYENACLSCHADSNVGDIAAVIELEYSIFDVDISISDMIVLISVLFIVVVLVISIIWYVFLHKYFVAPIKSLISQMESITTHEDLNKNIVINTKIDEIHKIEGAFNEQNTLLLNLYKELEDISNTDALTNIYNRKMFDTHSTSEIEKAKRYKYDFTILSMDLNRFKLINDTYGHDIGDELLIEFSSSVSKNLRDSDMLFRTGGDEFIAFLPYADKKSTMFVVEKIKKHFKTHLFRINDLDYEISASFGIAQYGVDAQSISQLLKIADIDMYEDKKKSIMKS